mgnify:CR=1 FL=1
MRKITQEACAAFENARQYKKSNTEVVSNDDGFSAFGKSVNKIMMLHGNLIAYSCPKGTFISNGGWSSVTTKERLNGLTGVHIQQKDFVWYLNGEEWNGGWIRIGD